ncbi:hypothetical protein Tco_0743198 [Tanacetum coccineum]
MTKVIKGEFEKIKDVKVKDIPLTYDASLEVFNDEVSRLSKMEDGLFTYEVEAANIPCDSKMDNDSEQEADDDMGYDSGDDEVDLTDEESSDDKNDIAEVFRIDTNIFDYETPLCSAFKEFNYLLEVDLNLLTKDILGFKTYADYKDDWIYEWNKDVPWVDEKPWTDIGVWTKPTPVKHTCKPFNYKTRCSEWSTCSWKDNGYYNGGNLPRAYIIGNQLHYQDYECTQSLERRPQERNINEVGRMHIVLGTSIVCDVRARVLYKVEDIVTCLVEYVKFWDDWEVDHYGNANLGMHVLYLVGLRLLVKVRSCLVGVGSEDEVESVENEMAVIWLSKPSRVGYDTKSMLEQWRESYVDADYDP